MHHEELIERLLDTETVFQGKLLQIDHCHVQMPDGRVALREIVRHVGAAAIVPVDGEGRVTLVWQYRPAIGQVTLEVPAGKLNFKGEDHLTAAQRELREETGLTARSWRLLSDYVPTPGYSDEVIALYLATGLSQGQADPDDDEFLRLAKLPLSEAVDRVMRGEITDGKTVSALLMAERALKDTL